VWKLLLPSPSFVLIKDIYSLTLKKDIGVSLSTWVLIINNDEDLSVRLSGITKEYMPAFIAGLVLFIKNQEKGRNILIKISEDDKAEFPLGFNKLMLFAEGKYDELFDSCQRQARTNQNSFSAHYMIARVHAENGQYPKAMQSLKKAVSSVDFDEENVNISFDFRNHPLIIYSVPDDIRDLS
jgi:hypothetical protein